MRDFAIAVVALLTGIWVSAFLIHITPLTFNGVPNWWEFPLVISEIVFGALSSKISGYAINTTLYRFKRVLK